MEHKGAFYGIEFSADGWRVTVGMRIICDGFDSRAAAVRWIRGR